MRPAVRAALTVALVLPALARAARADLHRPPPQRLSRSFFVGWKMEISPPRELEWQPREFAGPDVDATGTRVYAATRAGVALAVESGEVRWKRDLGAPVFASPLYTETALYISGGDGTLFALNPVTGEERWKSVLGEELGTQPRLSGGRLYVASQGGTLFAADAKTGARLWHHRREGKGTFTIRGMATPEVEGAAVFAGFADGSVAAFDAATGEVRWEQALGKAADYPDVDGLALDGGKLYAASYNGGLSALDARSGTVIWHADVKEAVRVAVHGPRVYVTSAGEAVALRRSDGKRLWSVRLARAAAATRPVIYGEMVIFAADAGPLFVVDAETGRPRSLFDPGPGFSGPPVVRRGAIYALSNGGTLYALGLMAW